MSVYLRTLRDVRQKAADHGAVLLAFSGGKDSLVVLDLCLRHFKRVECFHLEFVSDLDVTRERVGDPLARLGVPCRYYPDPAAFDALKRGVFCDVKLEYTLFHVPTDRESYEEAAADAGIDLVATGKKKSDYRQRAFQMNAGKCFGWHPLADWRKVDVLTYCETRGLSPPANHKDAGGIDLTAGSLCWLKQHYPADFRKFLRWFPYAEAAVIRLEAKAAREAAEAEEAGPAAE